MLSEAAVLTLGVQEGRENRKGQKEVSCPVLRDISPTALYHTYLKAGCIFCFLVSEVGKFGVTRPHAFCFGERKCLKTDDTVLICGVLWVCVVFFFLFLERVGTFVCRNSKVPCAKLPF